MGDVGESVANFIDGTPLGSAINAILPGQRTLSEVDPLNKDARPNGDIAVDTEADGIAWEHFNRDHQSLIDYRDSIRTNQITDLASAWNVPIASLTAAINTFNNTVKYDIQSSWESGGGGAALAATQAYSEQLKEVPPVLQAIANNLNYVADSVLEQTRKQIPDKSGGLTTGDAIVGWVGSDFYSNAEAQRRNEQEFKDHANKVMNDVFVPGGRKSNEDMPVFRVAQAVTSTAPAPVSPGGPGGGPTGGPSGGPLGGPSPSSLTAPTDLPELTTPDPSSLTDSLTSPLSNLTSGLTGLTDAAKNVAKDATKPVAPVGPKPTATTPAKTAAKATTPSGAKSGGPGGAGGPKAGGPAKLDPAKSLAQASKFPRATAVNAATAMRAAGPIAGQPGSPGAMGAGARGAGSDSDKEHKRAKYLDSKEHLEEAIGDAPAAVRPVVEK